MAGNFGGEKLLELDFLNSRNFTKAFDNVTHCRLLHIVKWYGIQGKYIYGLNFLSGRHHKQLYWDFQSSSGAVLGPILFLIYINALHTILCKTQYYKIIHK